MLSQPKQWKADYDRDGYLMIPDLIDPALLKSLRDITAGIMADPDAVGPRLRGHIALETDFAASMPGMNDVSVNKMGKAIKRIMELPLFDPKFASLIHYDPLLDVLETLFESTEFAFHNYKAIIKAPHVSSKFVWHRDLPYLEHSTPNLITAMLCLDEMTEANGATVVYPGTHRIDHSEVKPSDMDIPEDQLPRDVKPVTVVCPAGSAVLFHVNLVHGGGPNRSPIPRRNVIGIWSGPDTYAITAARYAYQDVMPRSTDPARQRQMAMTFSKPQKAVVAM